MDHLVDEMIWRLHIVEGHRLLAEYWPTHDLVAVEQEQTQTEEEEDLQRANQLWRLWREEDAIRQDVLDDCFGGLRDSALQQ
jgi:hypothetical protein